MKKTETAIQAIAFVREKHMGRWAPLPEGPWPAYVRLWRLTNPADVALVVASLSHYPDPHAPFLSGKFIAACSAEEAVENFYGWLPGGLMLLQGERAVIPGCCCSLEDWREWQNLRPGLGPWMGHDPSPAVWATPKRVFALSDQFQERTVEERPIVLYRSTYDRALAQAEQDLKDFLHPLRAWLDNIAPSVAADFEKRFKKSFINTRRPRKALAPT